ncbi:4-alpha-glucanotransferase, partial [Xanthomonas perforans]|nr:4-alpha-glucanotransferase [Xanthomonas perforans]
MAYRLQCRHPAGAVAAAARTRGACRKRGCRCAGTTGRRLHRLARGAGMSTRDPGGDDLNTLAAAAGVMVDWVDASDQPRQVSEQSVHAVLSALELPAATAAQRADSLR